MTETIEYYKKLLRRETEMKEEAAKVGLQLCEENNLLTNRIEYLQKQHLEELTKAEQEKYSLNLKFSQKCQVELSQASDLENAREQLDKQAKEQEHWKACQRELLHEISQLKKEREEQEEVYHDSQRDNKKFAERIVFLENQVSKAQSIAEALASNRSMEEEEHKLQLALLSLTNKNEELEQKLEEVNAELMTFKDKEERLRLLYQKTLEDIDVKNDQILSYSALLQSAKEEKDELQCEVEMIKAQQIDASKRGNSLFAEVDDNRHFLQQEMNILRLQHKSLQEKYDFALKQERKYKQQMATLLSMTVESVSIAYVHKLEQQLEDTKTELKTLAYKLKEANARASSSSPLLQPQGRSSTSTSLEEDYNCLNLLYDKMRQKKDAVEKELEDACLIKVAETEKVLDCQRRLFVAEHSLQMATAENAKLRLKVQEYSNSENGKSSCQGSKPLVTRTEKIPGFDQTKYSGNQLMCSNTISGENKENKVQEEKLNTTETVKNNGKHSKKVTISNEVKEIEFKSPKDTVGTRQEVVPTVVLTQVESPSQCAQQ